MDMTAFVTGLVGGFGGFVAGYKILETKLATLEKEFSEMKTSQEKREDKFMTRELCQKTHFFTDKTLTEIAEKVGRIESMLMKILNSGMVKE